jgi:hypothetical protein
LFLFDDPSLDVFLVLLVDGLARVRRTSDEHDHEESDAHSYETSDDEVISPAILVDQENRQTRSPLSTVDT